MIVGCDAKLCRVFAGLQICPQDAIVHHIEERTDTVPALVVEPDLEREKGISLSLASENSKLFGYKLVAW